MEYGCRNLTVLISGGTSGIGLAAAAKFLQDGARVYIMGRNEIKGAEAIKKLLAETGKNATYLRGDVTEPEDCRRAAQAAAQASGTIDILVNSAGIYEERRLENFSLEHFSEMMSVNIGGVMLLCQAALKYMYGGSIVNIASDAGISGNYGCPLYCASKGAVVAFSRALALDLAPKIRVNCLCPADVETPLLHKQLAGGGYTLAEMEAAYPLQKIGAAEEIAHVICFVASPANSFMTGSVIAVDGGLTAQ